MLSRFRTFAEQTAQKVEERRTTHQGLHEVIGQFEDFVQAARPVLEHPSFPKEDLQTIRDLFLEITEDLAKWLKSIEPFFALVTPEAPFPISRPVSGRNEQIVIGFLDPEGRRRPVDAWR